MPDLISITKSSPATTFILGADLLSQNAAGNYSTVRFYLKATNGPGGSTESRFLNWGEQVGSVDGHGQFGAHSGSPFLPQGYNNGAQRWLDVWDMNIPHNPDGGRGGITVRMRLNYGNIRNEEFTGFFNNFPSLAKAPSAPNIYSASDYTASSFGMNYTRGADNGAGIVQDHAQWARDPGFGSVVWDDYGPNGYTNPRGLGDGPGPELAPNTTYFVRVRSRNAVGWGGWSNTGSASTLSGVPAAPRFEQSTPGTARIVWSTPGNGGAAMSGFDLELVTVTHNAETGAVTHTPSTYNVSGTSFDLSALDRFAQYRARVRARNSAGVTAFSPWTADFSPASAPSAPVIGTVTQTAPDSFKVTWTAPVSDRGSALVGYTLYLATNPGFTDVQTFDIGLKNEHTFSGLKNSTAYFVRVAARNGVTPPGYAYLERSAVRQIVLAIFLDGTDGWTTFGPGDLRRGSVYSLGETAPIGLLRETYTLENTAAIAASTRGIQRTLTTIPGREYVFRANATALADSPLARFYKLGVVGIGSAGLAEIDDPANVTAIPEYRFTATATEHVLRIYMGAPVAAHEGAAWVEAVGFYDIAVTEYRTDSIFRLQSTVLESSLANHFSLACQSVGAAWWVDRNSVTRFRENAGADSVKAIFTDTRTPGALEYADVTMAYDSKNVVNLLEVTNYGRGYDGNEKNDVVPRVDGDSLATYGARKGTLTTNLLIPEEMVNMLRNPTGVLGTANWWVPEESHLTPTQDQFRYTTQAYPNTEEPHDSYLRFIPRLAIGHMTVIPLHPTEEVASSKPMFSAMVDAGTEYVAAVEVRTNFPDARVRMRLTWIGLPVPPIDVDEVTQRITNNDGWVRLATPPIAAPAGARNVLIEYEIESSLLALDASHVFDVRHAQLTPTNADAGYRDGFTWDENPSIQYTHDYLGRSIRRDWTIFDARVDAVIEDHAEPFARISSIRWNAQEDPALAAKLDIQDRIEIRRSGVAITDYRIVGRRDEVTAGRWMVSLEVVPNAAA